MLRGNAKRKVDKSFLARWSGASNPQYQATIIVLRLMDPRISNGLIMERTLGV